MQYHFDRHNILDILLPFIFVVCILSIQLFHWQTHKTVWKNYRVLFVSSSKDISKVMNLLKKTGVSEAISVDSINERFFADEKPPRFTQQEQYLQWFENKNDNLSYIYIPKSSALPLALLKYLHDEGINFYIEGNFYLQAVNLFSVGILFITFLCFSSRRFIFAFSTFPYLLLSPLVNGIVIFASILIFIVATFYAIEFFFPTSQLDSEQKKQRLRENISFFSLFFLAIILSFFDSFLFFVYIALSFVASICSLYIVGKWQHLFEKEKDSKRTHKRPIFYSLHSTFSSKLISSKKMIASSCMLFICYALPIIFFYFFFSPLNESYGNKLALPSPSNTTRYTDFSLSSFLGMYRHKSAEFMPSLINYICDEGDRKFNKSSLALQMDSIDENVDKNLINNLIDDKFISECLENIKANSIENLLLSEDGFLSAFYTFKFFPIERLQLLQLVISLLSIFTSLAIMLFKVVR